MLLSVIGHYSLVAGLCVGLIIIFFSIKNFQISEHLDAKILSFTFLQFILVSLSFLCLVFSFVFSDFSNETVFNNSHTTKPLFYKISGTWGNHEGSLLLWLLVLTLFIFLFLVKTKKQPVKYKILTLLFQQIIIIGFFIFLIQTSNPFNYIYPTPEEGLGLNPILQDPALAIHPPILYLGYVGSSIIFSSALAATCLNIVSKKWASHIKKWVLISWIFLTLGILLGSIWAYYELGWGGFWFWDPVENVSLMPWLALTTLLHCILVLEKKQILTSWVIILSISTFTLSMCGTFLVRSGILNSVHTFANDPGRGLFILVFLFSLILISLFVFFFFHKSTQNELNNFSWLSKETSIIINNWFMMYFLSVVLIGTVYPIFLDVLSSQKISVGPPFYHKLIVPFLIPFLLAMAIGPKLKWVKSNLEDKFSLILLLIISVLISFFILKIFEANFLINTILISSAAYLFFTTFRDFFIKKFNNISQNIAHFGFSLLILSILFNSLFSSEIITNLKVGETFEDLNTKIILKSIEQKEEKNFKSIIANFNIENSKGIIENLSPELRIYNQPNIVTSEADIKTTMMSDKFIVINIVQNQDYFNVRYQVKPFMLWIWLSVLLISFGGLLSLFKKNYE
ncbi:cytochrome c-type biogenesis protein [Candidatus Pelagibacter sp. HTCC7211]|uniref:heme lyase CcmF/NrfE family subunit n=1 Tax=Pelagibacter sp. (strain HTCC7211) TaxID=439493 RepID=UPI0001839E84|nr:heme lyase CcmF/NrfE family subunit [Candidatus Pelagibacter sp. HTCC7211]EDZ61080.1 cytochrome c-type biogenesis protein [Candidatus Pelagibacter sp. HTCC7211]